MDVLNKIIIVIIEATEHMSGEVLISKGLANGGQRASPDILLKYSVMVRPPSLVSPTQCG